MSSAGAGSEPEHCPACGQPIPQVERPTVSLVLPIFNEEDVIPELARRLREWLGELGESYEVVFVNDGSRDRSYEMLEELAEAEPRYKIISFARNFGHQVAITAGVDHATGQAVVVMDADLQDPPEVVTEMIAKWRSGYDVVYAVRGKRLGETWFKRFTAAAFYRVLRPMIGISIPLDAGDFRLMSRAVVTALGSMRETHRFVRGMVAWVGFRQTEVRYDRPGRFAGETKYPLRKMLKFAVDAVTSFSIVPLRFAILFGLLAGLFAGSVAAWALLTKLFGRVVPGWTTLMMVTALGFSAQFLMIGILGEYVGRIYEEIKRRPLYIVDRTVNLHARTETAVPPPIQIARSSARQ
jgi:glycosyltransferase involved in cell wall biosynthesis